MNKKFDSYLKSNITYQDQNKIKQNIPVKIKPRGKYRRRICDFPPLRLKFDKEQLNEMGLANKFTKLKLVTHCLEDKDKAKENILREYLAYKLFELHTEKSFRVHLVKITYKFPNKRKTQVDRYSLLIENEEELARRLKGKPYEKLHASIETIQPYDLQVNAMYQYMIGNSDWDPVRVRNIKLFQCNEEKQFTVVPYDFDFSGLVNAPYAIPNPNLNIKGIRDRVLQCKFNSEEELNTIVQFYLAKKETVLNFCKEFKALPKASRKDILNYLNSFYDILENEKKRKKEFMPSKN